MGKARDIGGGLVSLVNVVEVLVGISAGFVVGRKHCEF